MPTWITGLFVVLLAASAVSLLLARRGRTFGGGSAASGWVDGSMTITSVVVGEPDRTGASNCTVTGTVVGPGAPAVEVYGRMVSPSASHTPTVGQDLPVVYKPGKVDSTWRFGTLSD